MGRQKAAALLQSPALPHWPLPRSPAHPQQVLVDQVVQLPLQLPLALGRQREVLGAGVLLNAGGQAAVGA
jgi:hypothetical protein